MKYNTKRIAEVQKNKNILTNKNKQSETQYKLSIYKLSKAKSINNNLQILVYW